MDNPTFESIVDEHGPFIRRTLAQLGVASRDLCDVEQEVLRGVHKGLPTFDPELSANPSNALRGWLFAICERQAANHRRARLRRGERLTANDQLDGAPAGAPDSEERLIAEEHRAILMDLLDQLEPLRRAVIVAYELEGIAMASLAAAFAIPLNTAWNRLRLAREDLREAWERHENSWGGASPRPARSLHHGDAEDTEEHGAEVHERMEGSGSKRTPTPNLSCNLQAATGR